MRGAAQHLLADQLEAFQWKTGMGRVPGNEADLWRHKDEVDVRDVVWDVVFKAKSELITEGEPAMLRPERVRRAVRSLLDDWSRIWGSVLG